MPDPSKKYSVILSDPPWRYDFSRSSSRKIENQYPTMTVEELCAMDVPSADNAVLYLWATSPKLPEAFKVMESWGFQYRSNFVWVKDKLGMGYWARSQHELLLVGVKGNFSPPCPQNRISSVITGDRVQHSRKPYKVKRYLSKPYPKLDKLEMFSRTRTAGWDVFGNMVDSDVEMETPEMELSDSAAGAIDSFNDKALGIVPDDGAGEDLLPVE